MNKTIAYMIAVIFEAITIGLIVRYTNYEVAILILLIEINCRMSIKDQKAKKGNLYFGNTKECDLSNVQDQ